jgi:hypothetical protein
MHAITLLASAPEPLPRFNDRGRARCSLRSLLHSAVQPDPPCCVAVGCVDWHSLLLCLAHATTLDTAQRHRGLLLLLHDRSTLLLGDQVHRGILVALQAKHTKQSSCQNSTVQVLMSPTCPHQRSLGATPWEDPAVPQQADGPHLVGTCRPHRSLLQQLSSTTSTALLALLAHALVHTQLLGCLLLLLLTLLRRGVVLHLCRVKITPDSLQLCAAESTKMLIFY